MAVVLCRARSLTYFNFIRFGLFKMSSEVKNNDKLIDEFVGKADHHCGVHIDSTKEPCDVKNIVSRLRGMHFYSLVGVLFIFIDTCVCI